MSDEPISEQPKTLRGTIIKLDESRHVWLHCVPENGEAIFHFVNAEGTERWIRLSQEGAEAVLQLLIDVWAPKHSRSMVFSV